MYQGPPGSNQNNADSLAARKAAMHAGNLKKLEENKARLAALMPKGAGAHSDKILQSKPAPDLSNQKYLSLAKKQKEDYPTDASIETIAAAIMTTDLNRGPAGVELRKGVEEEDNKNSL